METKHFRRAFTFQTLLGKCIVPLLPVLLFGLHKGYIWCGFLFSKIR